MSWAGFGTGVAEAAVGGLGSALGTPSSAPQAFYGAPVSTNVSVSGLNLGSILEPMQQGSPANGGSGINYTSRFLNGLGLKNGQVSLKPAGNTETDWFLVGTAVVIAVAIIAFKKRGRR